jgi:hypothetical protein
MKLGLDDVDNFRAACVDPWNDAAQELLNVFGVSTADELLAQMSTMPVSILSDLVARFWDAVNAEVIRAAEAHYRVSSASGPAPSMQL